MMILLFYVGNKFLYIIDLVSSIDNNRLVWFRPNIVVVFAVVVVIIFAADVVVVVILVVVVFLVFVVWYKEDGLVRCDKQIM